MIKLIKTPPLKQLDILQTVIDDVECKVIKWLKQEPFEQEYITMEVSLYTDVNSKDHYMRVIFRKAEIKIKGCANQWDVWRIASSPFWHRLVSCCVGSETDNSCQEGLKLPNEVQVVDWPFAGREQEWLKEQQTDCLCLECDGTGQAYRGPFVGYNNICMACCGGGKQLKKSI